MNTRWGGKTRTDREGKVTKAWDHDPPAKEKLVPFGVLILLTGALTLIFGQHETSDFWGDCLRAWWTSVKDQFLKVRRLTLYLDNGPKNSGTRTQFLKRLIEFADWSAPGCMAAVPCTCIPFAIRHRRRSDEREDQPGRLEGRKGEVFAKGSI